jgi:hypothetical protein
MIIFWIIYILGIIATLYFLYYNLNNGDVVTVSGLTLAVLMSLFSWITFFIILIIIYGDETIFTKK